MARIVSYPSMIGIMMSISTTVKSLCCPLQDLQRFVNPLQRMHHLVAEERSNSAVKA